MRALLIGFGMIVTSLAVIILLSAVLETHAERGHAVEAGFNPRQDYVVTAAKNTSSFFQRMAKRIFHDRDPSPPEQEK